MKFIMIVLMTSWEPRRAFNRPGMAPHAAPLRIAVKHASGIRNQAERLANVIPAHAVANAAIVNCPSAPMFSSPQRKPTVTASPVKISGVA